MVLLALLALAPMTSAAQPSARGEARAQLVALALAGKVADIEHAMQSAQEAFERDPTEIHRIGGLLDGIEDKRLPFYDIERQLDQWVARAPKSYAARLLRGHYLGVAAGRARGTAWARKTSEAQFAKMRELHARSRTDLQAAIETARVPLHARVRLMWNALVGGQRQLFREQYELALAHSPGNLRLRRVWMASLEPRWGGSHEAMDRYAAESATALTPAQAAELKAASLSDQASMLNSAQQYDEAVQKWSAALLISNSASFYSSRAEPLARLGRVQEALDDLQTAFKSDDFILTHAAHALTIIGRKHPQLAGVHDLMEKALQQHPDEADLLNLRGFRLQQSGDQRRAYQDYRAAAETGDAWAETMVGKFLFNGFGGVPVNREEGLIWLKRAAAKGESNAQLSVVQALEAMGRQGEIAAARAEFQQADQRTFGEKVSAQSREAFADPKEYLLRKAATLWAEHGIYLVLYVLVLALGMLIVTRKKKPPPDAAA